MACLRPLTTFLVPVVVLALGGCRFLLDRQIAPGEVRGYAGFAGPSGWVPAEAAVVQVVGGTARARTDSKGLFVLRGLPPGRIVLKLTSAPNEGAEPVSLRLPNVGFAGSTAADAQDLGRLTLGGTGDLEGTVLFEGAPAAEGQVVLTGVGARTIKDGKFAFAGLPPGEYQVRVFTAGVISPVQSVSIAPKGREALSFDLRSNASAPSTGDVQGVVQVGPGVDRSTVRVHLVNSKAADVQPVKPDENGRFVFKGVDSAVYAVAVTAKDENGKPTLTAQLPAVAVGGDEAAVLESDMVVTPIVTPSSTGAGTASGSSTSSGTGAGTGTDVIVLPDPAELATIDCGVVDAKPGDADADNTPDAQEPVACICFPGTKDVDQDGLCDSMGPPDADYDQVPDDVDLCPNYSDPVQRDSDRDGVGDACDNCPEVSNPPDRDTGRQIDSDGDGRGDVCQVCRPGFAGDKCQYSDQDTCRARGIADNKGACLCRPGYAGSNCERCDTGYVSAASGGACVVPDKDADGVPDAFDNCPEDDNAHQDDSDNDAVGDVCDNCVKFKNRTQADIDNDRVGDSCDNCPLDSNPRDAGGRQPDRDGDGIGDACASCPAGTAGTECQYSDRVTCNGRGAVDDTGACTCRSGAAGASCEYSDADTCRGRGSVNQEGACSCRSGTAGATCEYTDADTCQGRGSVDGNGACTCRAGAAGATCQYTDADTCQGRGSVDGNGACTCRAGAAGATCQYTDTDTCRGRGAVDKDGVCTCRSGAAGATCQYTDADTCQGRGAVDASGACQCQAGVAGDRCQYTDATTCRGQGVVDASGACTCVSGFAGSTCQYSDVINCEGRGRVDASGACTCSEGAAGSSCQYTDAEECKGRGRVDREGRCSCGTGYVGADCSACAAGYRLNDQSGECLELRLCDDFNVSCAAADRCHSASTCDQTTGHCAPVRLRADAPADCQPCVQAGQQRVDGQCLAAGSIVSRTVAGVADVSFVVIPPGSFTMGSIPEDPDGDIYDRPAHKVTFTRGFLMGRTEATWPLWEAVYGSSGPKPKSSEPWTAGYPVRGASWDQAAAFCNELSDRDSLPRAYSSTGVYSGSDGWRLPTEAEWEYAARAGTVKSRYADTVTNVAWIKSNSEGGMPHTVGLMPANPWGLVDMLGNVEEWTEDWYTIYSSADLVDPRSPVDASQYGRVARGGSYFSEPAQARSAARTIPAPSSDGSFPSIGIRLVRSLPSSLR